MGKHKPPTKSELAQWEKYGSYAGHDAVRRMIVEIDNLRARLDDNATRLIIEYRALQNVNEGLVETVVDLRAALRKYGQHTSLNLRHAIENGHCSFCKKYILQKRSRILQKAQVHYLILLNRI